MNKIRPSEMIRGSDLFYGHKVFHRRKKLETFHQRKGGIKVLRVQGKIEKGMFGKNALKGNGTGKKGKGMKIFVESKKDAKALKKQLKKAGAGKAKVSVE